MQRVHQEDLIGYLLEQGGFEVLNLRAIAQSDAAYELGPHGIYERRKGELLHPSHEPVEVLRELKKNRDHMPFHRSTSNRQFRRAVGLSSVSGSRVMGQ